VVPAAVTDLRERFVSLLRRLGATGDPAPEADAVLAAWAEPARRYHDLVHLRDGLARLDEAPAPDAERDLVEAALWFHDVVYDPGAPDNEGRSAAWATRALGALGVPRAVVGEVARLVLLTRHDAPASDPAGRLLCDVDLSILGSTPDEFDMYDRGIRAEYAWVPEEAYRHARREVLAALLRRQPLYQTEHFRRRYEASARANLERALGKGES
jgi:predicted metal-dependent HD superfamily phosphohydrolase